MTSFAVRLAAKTDLCGTVDSMSAFLITAFRSDMVPLPQLSMPAGELGAGAREKGDQDRARLPAQISFII